MSLQVQSRFVAIFNFLESQKDYVTLNDIANRFGVSKRTVQNDIEKLIKWIDTQGISNEISIIRKSGQGILIKPAQQKGEQASKLHQLRKQVDFDQSITERRMKIIQMLLMSNDWLTMQFFADCFYVSKSVIERDLKWVEEWLGNFHLSIHKRRHSGVIIEGSEKNRRNAMAKVLTRETSPSVSAQAKREKLHAILVEAEERFDFALAEEYVDSILIHFLISIERLAKGNDVSSEDELLYEQCWPTEMVISEYIASRIAREFNVVVPLSERVYICMHLMGAIIYNNSSSQKAEPISEDIKRLTALLTKSVSEKTGIDFTYDRTLKAGLEYHLKLAVYRLRHEFAYSLTNPQQMSSGDEEIWRAVENSGDLFLKYCGTALTPEETAPIAAYFCRAKERMKKWDRALIVSDGGVLASEELSRRISELVPEIEIADVCTLYQLKKLDPDTYDFIITSYPKVHAKKPVILVGPTPGLEDMKQIRNRTKYIKRHPS